MIGRKVRRIILRVIWPFLSDDRRMALADSWDGPHYCNGCDRWIFTDFFTYNIHIDRCDGPGADEFRNDLQGLFGRRDHE